MISAEKFYSYLGELIVEERDVRADAFPNEIVSQLENGVYL